MGCRQHLQEAWRRHRERTGSRGAQTRLEACGVGCAPWTLQFFRPQFPNPSKIGLILTVVEIVK